MTGRWDREILFDDTSGQGASYRFSGRLNTLTAWHSSEVEPLFDRLEEATANGQYAAGYVAYEAATAFSPHLPSLSPVPGLPLAWFAVYEQRIQIEERLSNHPENPYTLYLETELDEARYLCDVETIRNLIAGGDCYQANYTFPMRADFSGDLRMFYHRIANAQKSQFCAFLDTGLHQILSASPELFFRRRGNHIEVRPMKGTLGRGRYPDEDDSLARLLKGDPKERAENLMIVDLLRNDLGMIAGHGSVQVNSLFDVERYPSVHQMTSAVSARLKPDCKLLDIFDALFPCGSVTGAPKRRAMEILTGVEKRPRGLYCGVIGMVAPLEEAVFSVAIRTLVRDVRLDRIELAVGSGITWYSDPEAEFRECRSKALFAVADRQSNGLIESLLREKGSYPLLDEHLARMAWSAARIGIPFDCSAALAKLSGHELHRDELSKVRLILHHDGNMAITSEPFKADILPLKLALSQKPVDPNDLKLYLKLTDRSYYESVRAEHPDADEVIMINLHGELTEGTYHNLVLKLNGTLVTPPISSGLLPGVMRGKLLAEGVISEMLLYPQDLERAEEIWLVNAVRGWRKGVLIMDIVKGAALSPPAEKGFAADRT